MAAIDVDNVSKQFRLYTDRAGSVKELFTKFGRPKYEDFWAVREVSLSVPPGSVHGLIGHNGCGKSTLLRMMAGIHKPTSGRVTIDGRVSALLELGAGFHPELTGRENVYLNASILGLSRKQTDAVYDRIVTFSGLEAFMDSPVKHYSSGMFVRLGFSVAVHVEPQILLVDEVIAVGDEDFQRRCLDHLASLKRQGVTIVLVSHAMGTMQNLCDHITWMDHGQVRQSGDPMEVTGAYLHEVNEREAERNSAAEAEGARSADVVATTSVNLEFLDRNGRRIDFARTGEPLTVRVPVEDRSIEARALLTVESESGIIVGSTRAIAGLDARRGMIECTLDPFTLGPGNFIVAVELFDGDGERSAVQSARTVLQVRSEGRSITGMVDLPATWGVIDRDASNDDAASEVGRPVVRDLPAVREPRDRPQRLTPRFLGLDPRLDPYGEADNGERVRRLNSRNRRLSRPAGTGSGLSIIVLNKDHPELLAALWESFAIVRRLGADRGIDIELLVGDTGSTEAPAIALLDSPPEGATIVRNLDYQFSRNNNDLFERSRGEVVLFMNNDVLIDDNPAAIVEAYEHLLADPHLGVLGAVLYFADGTIQHAGMEFLHDPAVADLPFHPGARSARQFPDDVYLQVPAVTGAFMMMPAALFQMAGGFDEGFAKECQDVDLCLRVRRLGRGVEVASLGHLVHLENATRRTGEEDWPDRALFVRRWSTFIEGL